MDGVQITVCQDDLPRGLGCAGAVDTETMGLNWYRLCLVRVRVTH